MNRLIRKKAKAGFIHLCISVLVLIVILYLILVDWYPAPFFQLDGGWDGLILMAAVDLILGPSLTLIIYNHTKPRREIIIDLSVVAAIQITALVWGGFQVYGERPVALVMWEGVFYTVTEDYYEEQGFKVSDLTGFSSDEPLMKLAYNDHKMTTLSQIRELNKREIPPYAQVHLYRSIMDNLDIVMPEQLSAIRANFLGIKLESGQHVFEAMAKHGNLLVYLDEQGRLIRIIEQPVIHTQDNPSKLTEQL